MNSKYIVRAKLKHGWPDGAYPSRVPITIGPFTINQSPNIDLYALRQGIWEPSIDENLPEEDFDYPVSSLYIDCEIQVPDKEVPLRVAEEAITYLESLFRLFQPGGVYIRRHGIWQLEEGKSRPYIYLSVRPARAVEMRPRPVPAPFYDQAVYDLGDAKLAEFKYFFDRFWEIIQSKRQPLDVAINRFNSSYEHRTLGDRLIDLMIAVEALLGNRTEVTYKISLRFACMLYPPGEARGKAFYAVKKVYDERSNIIHGEKLDTKFSEEEVHNFEEHVRKLIVKFLELCKQGIILNDKNIDRFVFFGNVIS